MAWWETLFEDAYPRLWSSLLTPERTSREVAGIEGFLELALGASILDLCCGQGRITMPLAQKGYRMTGLDLSERLLELARAAAREAGVDVRWRRADMRDIPWEEEFDAVISIFTSFGYFEDEAENQRVLEGVRRALVPGGKFLIDVNHRDRMVQLFQDRYWFEVEDIVVWVERHFDPVKGISRETMRWLEGDEERQRSFSVRCYTATELARMLRRAGLEPVAFYGDFDQSEFTKDSRRLIVLAEKSASV